MNPVDLRDEQVAGCVRRPAGDVEAVTAACQDPETQRWIPVPVPYERGTRSEFGRSRADRVGRGPGAELDPTRADGRLLGTVALHAHDETMREIGYWTAPGPAGGG